MIRVVLVDDQSIVRAGFRVVLETAGGIEVVGEASGGREAVELVRRLAPDVVVMDVRMPGGDGIEATRAITGADAHADAKADTPARAPGDDPQGPAVLVATTFDLDEYVFGALEAGARGFVLKDAEPEEFIQAVRALAEGRAALDGVTTRRVMDEFTRRRVASAVHPGVEVLTPREQDIVRLLGDGLSNDEIGGRLVIETSTVKSHLTRIMTKLGTRDRLQTVVWGYRSGLLP
ncbi:response regulator [Clavibacter sepedonicus]|uniref:Two component system response regulator n=1 Tax=Clavibacter sepedonicus TaxID=31964 RepID=B0RG78_CLASE|nr:MULTISPECIES: response regulator transcription factor [Clavibacter]MBD5383330.1 response regulator transcription factor [Clavibacter sp.]OQJ47965.1 DNA-binding response regulator [Clavibacter sepedonicus]OQJ53520.1 DNA-binding response regulator [Clavibacter sepedonicus]UUK66370.1 response regulator transcription factor [Clavibacter sepedonicus]CAQ02370.1 putative two component system response regulator [Clavibacter sepedonicus]